MTKSGDPYSADAVAGTKEYISQLPHDNHHLKVMRACPAFKVDLKELVKHRSIDDIKLVLGQGDFALVAAKGSHESNLPVRLHTVHGKGGPS